MKSLNEQTDQRSHKELSELIEAKHKEIFDLMLSSCMSGEGPCSRHDVESRRQTLWEELAVLERQERESSLAKDPQNLRDNEGTIR